MSRLKVLKTYKLYIGGKFPRTESARFYQVNDQSGKAIANMCLSSRKDFRNAVVAARSIQSKWAGASAYNRSQILYRIAEMLEGRKSQFVEELQLQGSTKNAAIKEVDDSIDRWVYYAGWCDKYQQIFSSVNPVASSHFNFSVLEPTGVVAAIAPENSSLLGLTSVLAPVVASGNTCVVLASESKPLCSISFAEVLNSSDVPGGVVNILTGKEDELIGHMVKHMDVNSLWYAQVDNEVLENIQKESAINLKRIVSEFPSSNFSDENWQSPYLVRAFTETKTTWHPIEKVGESGAGY